MMNDNGVVMVNYGFVVGWMLLGIGLGLPIWQGVIKKMLVKQEKKILMAGERIVKNEPVVLHEGKVYSLATIGRKTLEKQAYDMLRNAPSTVNKNIE